MLQMHHAVNLREPFDYIKFSLKKTHLQLAINPSYELNVQLESQIAIVARAKANSISQRSERGTLKHTLSRSSRDLAARFHFLKTALKIKFLRRFELGIASIFGRRWKNGCNSLVL